MKITILTQTFPLNRQDSTAHFMYDFAEGFRQLGHQVTVVAPWHPDQKLPVRMFKYVWPDKYHLLGYGRTLENDQKLNWWAYFLIPFYFIFGLIALWKTDADIINAHWIIPNGLMAMIVGKLKKIPVVITLPGSDVYVAKKFGLKWRGNFVSNSQQLLDDLGVEGKVISYGVPFFAKATKGKRNIKLATAGRRVEKKGIEVLMRLFGDIEVISGLNIDQFRRRLAGVKIFIAWSIRDSRGNLDDASLTVLEAMAAGCTVVASDLPGYRNIITDGVDGYLAGTEEELVTIVKTARDLGQEARKTVKRRFTSKKIAMEYGRVFEEARHSWVK